MSLIERTRKKMNSLLSKTPKGPTLSLTSLASVESLSMPIVQVIVLNADMGCAECRKRVSSVISRMDAETESMVVDVLEKKVILTSKAAAVTRTTRQVATLQSLCQPGKSGKKMLILLPPCS